jgi:hypothetical protein
VKRVKVYHLLPAERDCYALYAVAQPPYLSVLPVVAWGRVKRREGSDEEVVGFVAYLDVRPADELDLPLRFISYFRKDLYPDNQLEAMYAAAREIGRRLEQELSGPALVGMGGDQVDDGESGEGD